MTTDIALYQQQPLSKTISLHSLRQQQADGEKIACIALYDGPMAALAEQSGIELVLVGDSLGMTVQSHDSTLPVTMEHMVYHVQAVRRGNKRSFLIADMPFMAYATPEQAMTNAALLMQAGANMVKLEGGQWLGDTVHMLTERGIPVCAHLGLTPQSVHKLGGYRVQGRQEEQAQAIIQDALTLEQAGADLLVLECVPSTLTHRLCQQSGLITIGIGAGADTNAQVLVINDLIGITAQPPKFSKNFLDGVTGIADAMARFSHEVKQGIFPAPEHQF